MSCVNDIVFNKLRKTNQKTIDTVNGYIRGCQQLLTKNKSYLLIPLINNICLAFYYLDPLTEIEYYRTNEEKLMEAYTKIDIDDNEDIELEEFRNGLQRLDVELTDDEMEKIFNLMDYESANYVDSNDFVMFLSQNFESSELTRLQEAILTKIGGKKRGGSLIKDTNTNLQNIPNLQAKTAVANMDPLTEVEDHWAKKEKLMEAYTKIDIDDNGDVELEEFRNGLQDLNVELTHDEIQQLFNLMDDDESGYVDSRQFVMFLIQRFESSELTRLQEAILTKIRRKKRKRLNSGALI